MRSIPAVHLLGARCILLAIVLRRSCPGSRVLARGTHWDYVAMGIHSSAISDESLRTCLLLMVTRRILFVFDCVPAAPLWSTSQLLPEGNKKPFRPRRFASVADRARRHAGRTRRNAGAAIDCSIASLPTDSIPVARSALPEQPRRPAPASSPRADARRASPSACIAASGVKEDRDRRDLSKVHFCHVIYPCLRSCPLSAPR
jgi:hypothetical protein